jgi:hypothetical protein
MAQSYGIMKKTLLAATIVTGTQTFNDLGFTPNWVRIKSADVYEGMAVEVKRAAIWEGNA